MKNIKIISFIVGVFLLLGCISYFFPEDGVQFTIRFPSIKEIFSPKKDTANIDKNLQSIEQGLAFAADSSEIPANSDSLLCLDTLHFYQQFDSMNVARIYFPNNNQEIMESVFTAFENVQQKGGYLHILHYGDSQIELDRISGYFREALQDKFGGYGAGLLPVIPLIQSTPVGQTSSDSLPRYVASGTMRQKLPHNRYGVLAQMTPLEGGVTLTLTARNWKQVYQHTKQFSKVRLLIGNNAEDFRAAISAEGYDSLQVVSSAHFGLTELSWQLPSYVTKCAIRLQGKAELYAISLESTKGVTVDNIPLRGSAGTFFTGISSSLLQSSMKTLNVPMIILEYGGNVVPAINSKQAVENYKNDFARQIRYLQNLHPGVFILVIGPADMATKINGELQTWPYVEEVAQAMKEAALENGAAFWNMYEVMGGRNSMIQWVSHKPAWAASDYIHFLPSGAKRISDLFTQSFLHYYEYYKFRQRNSRWLYGEEAQPDEQNWAADSLEVGQHVEK